ncbi:MAG: VWA domain-containing protein [Terracidiphilus sp.]
MNLLRKSLSTLGICASLLFLLTVEPRFAAQDDSSRLHVNVVLVQLNIAVTDHKGHYISGLKPDDFVVTEDKIPEKIATFEEGAARGNAGDTVPAHPGESAANPVADASPAAAAGFTNGKVSPVSGADIFILFDTSNYMYRGFVYAQDAISDFVRSMDDADKIAFYSYSRDLSRATQLTPDRFKVVNGVRSTVAGDDAALYNSLLLTVKDAATLTGKKAIVVFSNGPDNASSVPPEDVAELAQSTGTIIYIVSTRLAQEEPVSTAAFERMSKATGGKAYFAGNWRKEKQAFASIREDLGHLYSISYYPQPNPNRGWRAISVRLANKDLQKYHIRTRDGYSVLQTRSITNESLLTPGPELAPRQ